VGNRQHTKSSLRLHALTGHVPLTLCTEPTTAAMPSAAHRQSLGFELATRTTRPDFSHLLSAPMQTVKSTPTLSTSPANTTRSPRPFRLGHPQDDQAPDRRKAAHHVGRHPWRPGRALLTRQLAGSVGNVDMVKIRTATPGFSHFSRLEPQLHLLQL
jgi:hypothetical protein